MSQALSLGTMRDIAGAGAVPEPTSVVRPRLLNGLIASADAAWRKAQSDGQVDSDFISTLEDYLCHPEWAPAAGLVNVMSHLAQSINMSGLDAGVQSLLKEGSAADARRFCAAMNAISLQQRLAALAKASDGQKRRHEALVFLMRAAWSDEQNAAQLPSWQGVHPSKVNRRLIDWATLDNFPIKESYLARIGKTIEGGSGGKDAAAVQRFGLVACCVPSIHLLECVAEKARK